MMRTSAALRHRRTGCWLSALQNLHLGIRAVQSYVTPIKLSTRKKRVQGSLRFGLTNFDTLLELILNNQECTSLNLSNSNIYGHFIRFVMANWGFFKLALRDRNMQVRFF